VPGVRLPVWGAAVIVEGCDGADGP